MGWFEGVKSPKLKSSKKAVTSTPSGLWKKCNSCGEILQTNKLKDTFQVCPYCDHHFRLSAVERVDLLIDKGTFELTGQNLTTTDPLNFHDKKSYKDRLDQALEKTGLNDGTLCGIGKIEGKEVSLGVMNFQFMGGSMGVVTGEKIAWVMDQAYEKKIPAIVVCCSGGARMQEGILSLMQMGKTSASRQRLKNAGIPFISVLTDPTTGGVAASFAMLGDVNIAEPKALIGFAGPRVIEQSIRQTLPEGFQRSEFLKDHGFIDRIAHRHELRKEISFFINMFQKH
ncbi:MAG: acetyl-CoA carboxylase, carboxyltransferase subunit beta [Bacteriovoracaceae bacterium]|nr:acetyl-CoA carboxylase, carboxyltransferase subunit beta [Bacteriovoracaceae bacterium]